MTAIAPLTRASLDGRFPAVIADIMFAYFVSPDRKWAAVAEMGEYETCMGKNASCRPCCIGASRGGHLAIVKMMVDRGIDISTYGAITASKCGWVDIVRFAMKRTLSATTTYLMMEVACFAGHIEVVRLLLVYKDNLDHGLYYASKAGHADIVTMLINAGASATKASLMLACKHGHLPIARLMLDRLQGQKIDTRSLIDLAARGGHADILNLLHDLPESA